MRVNKELSLCVFKHHVGPHGLLQADPDEAAGGGGLGEGGKPSKQPRMMYQQRDVYDQDFEGPHGPFLALLDEFGPLAACLHTLH